LVHCVARVGEVAYHGIGITPGETTAVGSAGTRPVLLLRGRPQAIRSGS